MSLRQSEQPRSYQKEYTGQQVDYSSQMEPDDRKTYYHLAEQFFLRDLARSVG
jgi:hypothetical protein